MPLIVSPSLITNTPADELADRLKRPHIGWHNVLTHQSVSCPRQLKDPLTWNRWRGQPIIRNDILIDRSSVAAAGAINYIGIASHNLGTLGRTVSIGHFRASDGWTTLASFTPTTDDAIMVIFEDETTPPPGNFDQWQVSIASGSSVAPEIGAMSMGRVLVMPHSIYGGHSPATLSRETEIEPNVSLGGRFLGRSIVRRGYRTDFEFRHLPAQWYREHFDPFVEHALRDPFFIAWKPDKFPDEVLYGWTTNDIRPVNMGVRDLMSVSFGIEGFR